MKVRGLDFNVHVRGEGTPFIWGHGMFHSIEVEDKLGLWEAFTRDVMLVRYDARGHGKSQPSYKTEDYHWRNLGMDMLAIADTIGAKQFIAGGGSLGCATTIYAALLAPERMKALVLYCPATAWETRGAQAKLYKRLAIPAALLGGRTLAQIMKRQVQRPSPAWMIQAHPVLGDAIAAGFNCLKARTLWHILRAAAVNDLPPRGDLTILRDIPTLILAWVGDPVHPASSAHELQRVLPKAELFVARSYDQYKTIPQRLCDFVLAYAHRP